MIFLDSPESVLGSEDVVIISSDSEEEEPSPVKKFKREALVENTSER